MFIDLFTDSDAILNFCPVDFCLKWTLYFVSTSNFMKEYQFSRLFDFGKLFNMSVKVYIFMKDLTMKKFSYTLGRVRILQRYNGSSSIFMKIPIYTSVVSVFIQVQNLFSFENGWKSLNFTRPRVVLTRNHKFKMSVNSA